MIKNIERFNKLVTIILKNEGGDKVTNDSDDPGGVTKYGISKKYNPEIDIKNLTEEQAKQIYAKKYYIPCGADDVNDDELALNLFDSAVNPGLGWASKTIQRLVNVDVDGIVGNNTIEAINNYFDKKGLIAMFKIFRKDYYRNRVKVKQSNKKYINGWLRRVDDLEL